MKKKYHNNDDSKARPGFFLPPMHNDYEIVLFFCFIQITRT